jgi:hypothetical protein
MISCCRTAVGVGQRALSLSAHTAGDPPLPGPGEGGVTTPFSWSTAGTTVASLLRGTGGFNHSRESLNPFFHTGGPRHWRSFRRRLHRWRQWHGSWSVEKASYVYVYVVASEYATARLRRHEEASATPRGSGYGDTSSFSLLKARGWFLRPTRLTLVFDVPPATPTCAWAVHIDLSKECYSM